LNAVRVRCVAGNHLIIGGNLNMFGQKPKPHETGNPFVRLTFGDVSTQTTAVSKTTEPKWGEELSLGVPNWSADAPGGGELVIEVFSQNGKEKFIGEATVELPATGSLRFTRGLQANIAKGASKCCGQVALEVILPYDGPARDDFEVFGWEPAF
jgi:hypothetical protein